MWLGRPTGLPDTGCLCQAVSGLPIGCVPGFCTWPGGSVGVCTARGLFFPIRKCLQADVTIEWNCRHLLTTDPSSPHQKLAFFCAPPSEQEETSLMSRVPRAVPTSTISHVPCQKFTSEDGGGGLLSSLGQELSLTKQRCLWSDRLPQKEQPKAPFFSS